MVHACTPSRCRLAVLSTAALVTLAGLGGCIAARPGADGFGTIGGIAPLSALATQEQLDAAQPETGPLTRGGDVMDRADWAPIALLAPSDLILHTPHYAPARLPETGDWRYTGELPNMLTAYTFDSGNAHQLKSLAYEPFLQVYDLIMIPVRMVTGTPPHRLDASPDASYIRAPQRWSGPLPMTGQAVGPRGIEVISRPSAGRQL